MEEIVDCIKNVEHILGNHYKENIYQFALYTELNLRGYMVQTEVIVPVYYKSVYVGFERADLVIYNKDATIMCILELKSQNARLLILKVVDKMDPGHPENPFDIFLKKCFSLN